MAEPKKRLTSTRSGARKSHKKIKVKNVSICLKCKQKKRPHFVCKNCGYYKNKTVI